MTRTLGIDLAAQDADSAYCVIEWDAGRATPDVPVMPASDGQLLREMHAADWIGVDAPFGWPDDFVAAVSGYHDRGSWPDAVPSALLRHRETDRLVHAVVAERTGKSLWPLSVSSDRIAVCAWRCARLLSRYAHETGTSLDRLGVPDAQDGARPAGADRLVAPSGLVEVYPAAALALWGLTYKGYKTGSDNNAAMSRRTAIIDGLAQIGDGGCPSPTASAWRASPRTIDSMLSWPAS